MVRVHFGPPLQEEAKMDEKPERTGQVRVQKPKWTRKPALGNSPVDCCNRRGFAAAKRVHLVHLLQIETRFAGLSIGKRKEVPVG